MPDTLVVDTNVILVANNKHLGVSPECVTDCALRLQDLMNSRRLALDDARRILREYLHKTHPNQPKGPGDAFVKWVLRNEHNAMRCVRVSITETSKDQFQEFPQDGELENFDPPDRKFVAVASAHAGNPPILQAADSKWLGWREALTRHGIKVEFVCEKDVRRFHEKKFPND
jgi:hypothetical protein